MSLLHPALLSGLGLAVIPVLLHLLLQAKPKRLIFPALRLIKQSRRQNVRRMQLRHLWLLLLAVGWPYARRVAAEIKEPVRQVAVNIPVAAEFLFDTSPSMSYREGNQTRLQLAQQIARD